MSTPEFVTVVIPSDVLPRPSLLRWAAMRLRVMPRRWLISHREVAHFLTVMNPKFVAAKAVLGNPPALDVAVKFDYVTNSGVATVRPHDGPGNIVRKAP